MDKLRILYLRGSEEDCAIQAVLMSRGGKVYAVDELLEAIRQIVREEVAAAKDR